uniref:Uncharacterized protein n=1 Tax=Leersia perrieri TaxID=77586 RepID=A0A0D9XR55_9ORYZ
MAWKDNSQNHQGNQSCGRDGGGFREEEEEEYYRNMGRLDDGRPGFQAGSGFGAQRNTGNMHHMFGLNRRGFRPRGGKGFGARHGGFVGRHGHGSHGGGALLGQGNGGAASSGRFERGGDAGSYLHSVDD